MMSIRRYLIIAVVTGIIVFALASLAGAQISTVIVNARTQASGFGVLANIIADPLIWGLTNPVPGAVVAALLWPALLIWLALLFIMILVAYGAAGVQDVNNQL
jgi:uncharacterized membrane protein